MVRNAEFSSKPEAFEIHEHDNKTVIELHDNIQKTVNPQGEECWTADIYYFNTGTTRDLEDRVKANFEAYLAKAKEKSAEEEAEEEVKRTRLNNDELTEILADQEYRICLLELGVEL